MGKIFVTQPSLPPLEEFLPYLGKIWESKWLTNGGPFHQEFERELAAYLGVEHLALFANATIALVVALQALRISGEVITTPYSFVATTHALLWNGIEPVFVDIDPITFNLDPAKIEAAITPHTTAIFPVHVYGTPCNVEEIGRIADIYGLKVIYDAAHAFGVECDGDSVLNFGDLSVLSFHATKVFNTFEGGAIVCPNAKTKQRIDYLKNFGIADEITVVGPGINGKMNEFQAAFGLLQLRHIDVALAHRARIASRYRDNLAMLKGISIPPLPDFVRLNHSYLPIFVEPEFGMDRDSLYRYLQERDIMSRRYFYPLISEFPMYRSRSSAHKDNLPVAHHTANRVLCLPIFSALTLDEVDRICDVLRGAAPG